MPEIKKRGSDQSTGDDHTEQRREMLNKATQETRFVLIQNILGHPEQLPSLRELDYMNPDKSKSTIRNHLEKLIESEIVTVHTLPEDDRERDLPWRFYGLTEEGRAILEQADLLGSESTLQEMFDQLEKTPKIEQYAAAPRP